MREPQSIASATFTVFGVEVKCHILDDGRRVVEADSAQHLFAAMAEEIPVTSGDGDLEALSSWLLAVGTEASGGTT